MAKFSIIIAVLVTLCSLRVKSQCVLVPTLIDEISSYGPVVKQIIDKVVSGDFKGRLFDDTATFVDTVGARVVGSQALDNGINYMLDWMRAEGFDDVHGEEIVTPNWIRGRESLEMIEPRYQSLSILGYGDSTATPGPIEAEIIVVRDYDELAERASEVGGKIVVYDHTFVSYGPSTIYRYSGAAEAAKRGAVAALVSALSNIAMDLPHTGQMEYDADESIPRIPLASISIDTAQMLGRMHRRGKNEIMEVDKVFSILHIGNTIKLRLNMEHILPGDTTSRNTFGQLTGSAFPDEKVIVSGHIDSWDVGQGAQDDGGAVMMSALVISLLKNLDFTPRRSIQAVGWTSEENGYVGVLGYIQRHLDEINAGKIAAAFESDSGLFVPLGYNFAGNDEAACIVQEILKLFADANFTSFARGDRVGSDVSYLSDLGVPTFDFVTANEKYFWYHHAESDTMSAMNSDELDQCLAVYAASAYVIADLSHGLTIRSPVPTSQPNGGAITKSWMVINIGFLVFSLFLST